jgi:8-oxo-dGTP diphosphatase
MRTIDKLAWIEIQDKSILSTKSYGKDKFYIPGGKREIGETDIQTLVREIKEELDVALKPETIEFVGIFEAQAHGHTEGVKVKMTCYMAKYTGILKAAAEIEEIKWLKYADKPYISEVDKIIFAFLKQEKLID